MATYRYDIYGEETRSAAAYNPYRYNVEYTDMSTGLQYLRARYYSPAITRFLSKGSSTGYGNTSVYVQSLSVLPLTIP